MQTGKRANYFTKLGGVIILIVLTTWIVAADESSVPFEVVRASATTNELNFDNNLNFIVSKARSLGDHVDEEKILAADVIAECESMRTLFKRSFKKPVSGSIDFILRVHQDSGGGKPLQGFDPLLSQSLIFKVILDSKYDLVLKEGSGFDGFEIDTQLREIFARLKYEQRSPMYQALLQRGVDPTSFEQVKAQLYALVENSKGEGRDWLEFQKKITSELRAGESIPMSVFVGRLIMGRISNSESKELIDNIQKIRSAYAAAKAIEYLKDKPDQKAAIVFGFLHESDFREIASVLGIKARIYNATGVSKTTLKEKP